MLTPTHCSFSLHMQCAMWLSMFVCHVEFHLLQSRQPELVFRFYLRVSHSKIILQTGIRATENSSSLFFLYFLVFLHSPKVISCHFAWWDISFIFFTFLNVFFSTSLRARFTSHSCIRTPLRSAFLSWMLGMGLVELREQLHPVARVPTEATLMKNSKFKLICSVGMPHASGSCSGFRFNLLVFFS